MPGSPRGIPLDRATPESQGVSSAAIQSLVSALDTEKLGVHSLMILRHGTVIAESWWHPFTPSRRHMMFSVSKSFTATAIGIAEAEGLLSIDDRILDFFPSRADSAARQNMAEVRVRHLLAMASGHGKDTLDLFRALPDADWVELFLTTPLAFAPGSTFVYNSGATFVLGALLSARTGKSVRDYLVPRLFEPLGMEIPPWAANSRGLDLASTGLRLYTEDVAKLGQLYLQRGKWNGQQLLSEDWVARASSTQVANPSTDMPLDWTQGYGFQFWRSRHDSFRADGAFGQFSLVLPEQDVVVAVTSGTNRGPEIPAAVWEHLLPGIGEHVPKDERDSVDLTTLLAETRLSVPDYLPVDPPVAATASGSTLIAGDNPFGIDTLTFRLSESELELKLTLADGTTDSIRAGHTDWIEGHSDLVRYEEIDGADTATIGGWLDPTTLELREQCIETPFARVWTIEFRDDGSVAVSVQLEPGPWIGRIDRFVARRKEP